MITPTKRTAGGAVNCRPSSAVGHTEFAPPRGPWARADTRSLWSAGQLVSWQRWQRSGQPQSASSTPTRRGTTRSGRALNGYCCSTLLVQVHSVLSSATSPSGTARPTAPRPYPPASNFCSGLLHGAVRALLRSFHLCHSRVNLV